MSIKNKALLLLVLALFNYHLSAQDKSGSLEGWLMDADRQPIENASILIDAGNKAEHLRGVTSDDQGHFVITALPPGDYSVKITHIGYRSVFFKNTPIHIGQTTSLGILVLQSEPLTMPPVMITKGGSIIDPISTTTGAILDEADYAFLPVDRNYRRIVNLLPHANASFYGDGINIAGATGLENKYFVDGVDVTDPFRGRTGTNLPYNFIKQVEYRAGGYEAEYESSLGGVINAVTNSGTDRVELEIFGFFTNNRFRDQARPVIGVPPKNDFKEYDLGISLGGPIIKGLLWYFLAYNVSHESENVEIPGHGFFSDRTSSHIFAAKVNSRISKSTELSFTVSGDPNNRDAVGVTFGRAVIPPQHFGNPDPYLSRQEHGSINLAFTASHDINNKILFDLVASHVNRRENYLPQTIRGEEEILFIDIPTATWAGGYPESVGISASQTAAELKTTLLTNNHLFKAGLRFKVKKQKTDLRVHALGRLNETNYGETIVEDDGSLVHNRIPGFFVQDSWRPFKRWMLNFGVRWEGQFLIGSDGAVAQAIPDQIQPRLGIVYQPGTLGTQKLFASFGRYYQELSTLLPHTIHNNNLSFINIRYNADPRFEDIAGDTSRAFANIQPEVDDLRGQYYDEFILGYEGEIAPEFMLSVRGIFRTLREGIENGVEPTTGMFVVGNPGRGVLKSFPRMQRDYTALELSILRSFSNRSKLRASYVLSRTYGNYPGLFNSDRGSLFPNVNPSFDAVETLDNGTGLLPNDRTHVFKVSGFHQFGFGLTTGLSFVWQSGTPLSEFGGSEAGFPFLSFIGKRGTAGRTPSLWHLNLRMTYDMNGWLKFGSGQRLILDILNVGSPQQPVRFEQIHYFSLDDQGQQTDINPLFGQATAFQPPMTIRVGLEAGF